MEDTPPADIFETTRLLKAWSEGDETAPERLIPLVDAEMRRLARRHLRQERPGHILQTTALVNEAWMRLINWPGVSWPQPRAFHWHRRATDAPRPRRRSAAASGAEIWRRHGARFARQRRRDCPQKGSGPGRVGRRAERTGDVRRAPEQDCRDAFLWWAESGGDRRGLEDFGAHRAAGMESGAGVALS